MARNLLRVLVISSYAQLYHGNLLWLIYTFVQLCKGTYISLLARRSLKLCAQSNLFAETCIQWYSHFNIVPFGKFHRIGGAPPETFPNVKYEGPEEVDGDRKCFDSPIRK